MLFIFKGDTRMGGRRFSDFDERAFAVGTFSCWLKASYTTPIFGLFAQPQWQTFTVLLADTV